jgi:carbon storage regulator
MLVISRRKGQRFLVGDVEIVVLSTHRGSVKLGVKAPEAVLVLRSEVVERDPPAPPTSDEQRTPRAEPPRTPPEPPRRPAR